jgi:hypothetical protein
MRGTRELLRQRTGALINSEMSSYQKEQAETLDIVREGLSGLSLKAVNGLRNLCDSYMAFRAEVDAFLTLYFSDICTQSCYQSHLSACCSKDGIVTFFADVVINSLFCSKDQLALLSTALTRPHQGFKCVYLSNNGCLWTVKPIVCAMFLCDAVENTVFLKHPDIAIKWKALKNKEKMFKWPDRPVLFDRLESEFLDLGLDSPLMYLHNSPGLLRIKQKAGLL